MRGGSSLVARWAHNPKVRGSNPRPAIYTGVTVENNYLLTIRIQFSAMDDPAARKEANRILESMIVPTDEVNEAVGNAKAKLQKLRENEQPIGISLE